MKYFLKANYRRMAKLSLALVYLVILAGAVVRMTGSGMGCPDWPKCFGYLIPPVEASELEWQANSDYESGQVIIREEALLLAREDFQSGNTFNAANWGPYTRHDYAEFNAVHTWVEYINRLLGALSGLAILAMAVCSLGWLKEKPAWTALAWISVVAIGFQAWLGATVVYSVLAPVRITLHMFMALLIVALLLWIVFTSEKIEGRAAQPASRNLFRLWGLTFFVSLMQILMGTQVRQFVDQQGELFGEQARELWLSDPSMIFYIHRSFSILVLLLHFWVAYLMFKNQLKYPKIRPILGLLALLVVSGIAMNYFAFPFSSQALHLFGAALLFGLQFYLLLEIRRDVRFFVPLPESQNRAK
ncbi:cytochrome c oxidase assembly protein subunit 15 [Robiginitalea myxolifaciens]|uniref:Cytochrome c oxidase assembly protein subunit 15 n=1 Tax=Robiginitalea myxolifaciens TaxID=400055 RepID=A0A1I6H846_9FLAO|nr:COX15/CtaA family protein [Robiginitalea myxolifaciens]SFR50645.1 cytochrome c oxidase assembly protein subunit 15 [Robiginitalea myxolifaciens]